MKNKIRILLIHPPLSFEERYGESKKFTGHIHPPQGLCHLASMFSENDYLLSIIDAQALFIGIEETLNKVEVFQPDYIGIMSFTISMETIAILYNKIKHILPNVKIILGGPHINACPEETLTRYPLFEVAVLNEGELTFPELIRCFENNGDLNTVKGIVYKDENNKIVFTEKRPFIKDLDTLPLPRWDLLPFLPDHYRPSAMTYRKLPAIAIVTSRGCPYRCTFCDRSVFGRVWRAHGPQTVLSWIAHLTTKYGIKDINFQDDHFMINKKRLAGICHGIKAKHPDLLWSTIGRTDSVDRESVRLMKESGCWQIAFGIESGSQQVLDVLKKDETVEQMEYAVRMTKEAGLRVKGLFMAGCPTETKKTLQETEKFIKKLDFDYISMSAFTPTPNTAIYAEWQKHGSWEGATPDDWRKLNLWEPVFIPNGLTKEYLKQFIKRAPANK